jgi:hypothetical protein
MHRLFRDFIERISRAPDPGALRDAMATLRMAKAANGQDCNRAGRVIIQDKSGLEALA